MNPFDFAWVLLKAKSDRVTNPGRVMREMSGTAPREDAYPPAPFYSSTDRGYEGDPNEGFGTPHHTVVDDEPTPDMEEPAAMAPDKPATGMSPEQKLQALLEEHPELREMMGGQ